MCGVLLVRSAQAMPQQRHEPALEILRRRGPDLTVQCWVTPGVFVAQTVLHITGTDQFYHSEKSKGFAYNGEIYDYRWYGNYDNDVELAFHAAHARPRNFQHFEGTWAWVYADQDQLLWASDPQGEKSLYMYHSLDLTVVSSDVAAVLCYIDPKIDPVPYQNKCWTMIDQTPWSGIVRCEPGRLYRNGKPAELIDSVWQWVTDTNLCSEQQVQEQFEWLWDRNIGLIRSQQPANISFSGGLDSSVIAASMPGLEPVTVDAVGKDPVVTQLRNAKISVDPESWAHYYRTMIEHTRMPAQSWSFVGKWLVAQHSQHRIVYTGLAADELFGGYAHHQNLNAADIWIASPYCEHDHNNLWHRCLDLYHGDARQATLLMDYWYQVVGVDAPGLDRLGGLWGKETRNPFMMPSMIKFALNLPWDVKVNKQLIRRLYKKISGQDYVQPKMGFAGHANDSAPWLGVNTVSTGNRYRDWQQIAQQTFYEYCQA